MLFSSKKDLKWQLVELLARRGESTAKELWKTTQREFRRCSLQAIYLHLRALQQDGVVVRRRGSYALGLWWAQEFLTLAQKIEERIKEPLTIKHLLPKQGSRLTWRFTNLIQLDDFWVQLITASFAKSKTKTLCIWIPHPWYYFAQREKILHFYSVLVRKRIRYFGIAGGDTFLDKLYVNESPKALLEARFGRPSFVPAMSVHECIIGSYIITVRLGKRGGQAVDTFFKSTVDLQSMDLRKLYYVLTSQHRYSIEIEHNERKAERKRVMYLRYFTKKPTPTK
jgi:hypothetical protein